MTLESPTHRVIRGFLTGGLVAFAGSILLPAVIDLAAGAVPLPRGLAVLRWSLPMPLSFVIGGIVAGTVLEAGRWGEAATGLAMLAAGVIQGYAFGYLDRLTGREDPFLVVGFAVSAGVLGFGVVGIIAGMTLKLNTRRILRASLGCAAAGLAGSFFVVAPFFLVRAGGDAVLGSAFLFLLLSCQALSILLPFIGCGFALGRALD